MDQAAQLRKLAAQNAPCAPHQGSEAGGGKTGAGKRVGACQSIAVTSGKGGVGKSNISLILAQSLARLRKRVLLFDADLGLANIHILLGMNPPFNLAHAVRGECELVDVLCDGPGGVHIVPGASGIEAMADIDSLALERLVRKLVELEAQHDFLIIDIGAGIGRQAVRLSSAADSACVVVTPEPTSLADAYATAKVLLSRGMQRIAVIVNMASSDKEGREVFEKLQALVKNFLNRKLSLACVLPHDRDVPRMVKAQRSIVIEKPRSTVSVRVGAYARSLCGLPPSAPGNFFSRLFGATRQE